MEPSLEHHSLVAEPLGAKLHSARRTRTLYVREDDQPVWEKAKELIGDSLSTYLTDHLKTLVATKQAEQQGFSRILLKFRDKGIPVAKAFYGRWLISPQQPYIHRLVSAIQHFAVAITPKQNVVVFEFEIVPAKSSLDGFHFGAGDFTVYGSFAEANEEAPGDLIAQAMERQGIVVQELDI